MVLHPSLTTFLFLFSSLSNFADTTHAFSWNFDKAPQQCANLSISIVGAGVPPYRILIVPFGPSPLPNNIEARRIIDQPFPNNANSVSFPLNFPASSQFVAIVSDSTGFGTGGTSVTAQVTNSDDTSCFDPTKNVVPDYFFSIEPPNQIVQCLPTRIWWDNTTVEGVGGNSPCIQLACSTPKFLGVIPGGQSFAIPEVEITNIQSQGTGFSWTPSLRGGTTFILIGGDNRGAGSAGSVLNTVSSGVNNIGTCLNDQSPSSTPGSPAGGSYPTGPNGGVGGDGGGNSNVTGPIVGGVVGGVVLIAALILLYLYFRRQADNRRRSLAKERPITIDDEDEEESPGSQNRYRPNEQPQNYQPEPFLLSEPSVYDGRTSSDALSMGRPLSGYTTTSFSTEVLGSMYGYGVGGASAVPSSVSRKGGAPKPMRPVNIVQHEDAGPSEPPPPPGEPDTIELPPAYTNIRHDSAAPSVQDH